MKIFESLFLLLISVVYLFFIATIDFVPIPLKLVMFSPVLIFTAYWLSMIMAEK